MQRDKWKNIKLEMKKAANTKRTSLKKTKPFTNFEKVDYGFRADLPLLRELIQMAAI